MKDRFNQLLYRGEQGESLCDFSCDVSNSKEKLDPIYSNNLMRMGSNYD